MLKTSLYFLILALVGPALMALQFSRLEPFPQHAYHNALDFNFPWGTPTRAKFVNDRLMILTDSGGLWSINEQARSAEPLMEMGPVLDICSQGDSLLLASVRSEDAQEWSLKRLSTEGVTNLGVIKSVDEGLAGLLCREDGVMALTSRRLIWFGDDGSRRDLRLSERVPSIGRRSLLLQQGSLLLGVHAGEWAGGLFRIDTASGHVERIEGVSPDGTCDRPLVNGCGAVVDIQPVPWRADCIALVENSLHVLRPSPVLQICGNRLSPLQSLPCDEESISSAWKTGTVCYPGSLSKVGDRLLVTGIKSKLWLNRNSRTAEAEIGPADRFGPFRITFDQDAISIVRSNSEDFPIDLLVVERPRGA